MDIIKTAESEVTSGITYQEWYNKVLRQAIVKGYRLSAELDKTRSIQARINHGRWIADCPFCRGAEFVFIDNPVFRCQSCYNQVTGGKGIPVILPAEKTEIERILLKRPLSNTRNWYPGETVKSLAAENTERGIR